MEILLLTGSHPRVPFVLMIKNGAAFDPIEKWGITYLTSWMILEQNESSTGLAVEAGLRELEAELDLRVEWDAIFFFGSAPSENLVDVLNLLAEMVVRPAFREETFQRLRNGVIQELEETQNQLDAAVRGPCGRTARRPLTHPGFLQRARVRPRRIPRRVASRSHG